MTPLKIGYGFYLLLLIIGVSACDSESAGDQSINDQPEIIVNKAEDLSIESLYKSSPEIKRDLDEIKKDGILKVVMTNSSTSYFIYRGQAMGYEFELLKRLADHLKLDLEIIVAKDNDDLYRQLFNGNADLIAHGLAVTSPREEYLNFTDYLVQFHIPPAIWLFLD